MSHRLIARTLPALALTFAACGLSSSPKPDALLAPTVQALVDPDDALVDGLTGFPDAEAHSGVFMSLISIGSDSIVSAHQFVLKMPEASTQLRVAIFDGNAAGLWDQNSLFNDSSGLPVPDLSVADYHLYSAGYTKDASGQFVPMPRKLIAFGESEIANPSAGVTKTFFNAVDGTWEFLFDGPSLPAGITLEDALDRRTGDLRFILDVSHRERKTSAINGYKVAVNGTLWPEITPSSTRQLIGGFIGGVVDSRDMNFAAGAPHPRYAVSRDHYPDTLKPSASLNGQATDPAIFQPAVRFPAPDAFANHFIGTFEIKLALAPDPGEAWADFISRITIEEGDADSGPNGSPPDDGQDYVFGTVTQNNEGYKNVGIPTYDLFNPHGVKVVDGNSALSGNVTDIQGAGWKKIEFPTTGTVAENVGLWTIRIRNLDARNTWFLASTVKVNESVYGSIGDRVWVESDCNGRQDIGELGVNGVAVSLFAANPDGTQGALVTPPPGALWTNPQLTHDDPFAAVPGPGNYLFDLLPTGAGTKYFVTVDEGGPLTGFSRTFPASLPSDTTLTTAAPIDLTKDFGYCTPRKLKLGDRLWRDQDCDGEQDEGEVGLNGVTVRLFLVVNGVRQMPEIATAITAGDGTYLFDNLDPATYEVEVDETTIPLGFTRTAPATNVWHKDLTADDLTADFGYCRRIKVGVTVYKEQDCDGIRQPGEPTLDGVLIRLFRVIGGVRQLPELGSAVTGSSGLGAVLFEKLDLGTYELEIDETTVPPGYFRTLPATNIFHRDLDADDLTLLAGYCTLRLGDRIWKEQDCDGIQEPGEPGINGVTVRLFSVVNGTRVLPALKTTVTAGDGQYLFDNLDKGIYEVEVDETTIPAGYKRTSPATNVWHKALTAEDLTADFGYCSPFKLGDRIWKEQDCDGIQEPGEPGINGVTVRLFLVVNGVRQLPALKTTVTAGDGMYLFEDLEPATYEVEVDETTIPAGYTRTSPATNMWHKDLTADDLTADFGYCTKKISLGDRIWKEQDCDGLQEPTEPGINGVTVRLFLVVNGVRQLPALGTKVTAGDGQYLFDNLEVGTYEVEVDEATVPAGFTRTSPATNVWHKDLTADDLTLDFGYCTKKIKLGDRLWKEQDCDGVQEPGEPGLNGVTVNLFLIVNGARVPMGTRVTAGDGMYLFDDLEVGTYEVEVDETTVPAGYTRTSPATSFWHKDLTADDLTLDFGYCTPKIKLGDRIWKEQDCDGVQEPGEPGLNGVTVNLFLIVNGARVPMGTQVTAGDGMYLFDDLEVGTYEVEVDETTVPAGYTRTAPATNVWHKDLTADDLTLDFGYCTPKIRLGDRIWKEQDCDGIQEPGEPGINGVTVRLFAIVNGARVPMGTQVTAGDGEYLFDDLEVGTYEVEVDETTVPAGYTRTSPATNVWHKDLTAEDLTLDFGYCTPKIKLGDRLWKEQDCDGIEQPGEPGLSGVTVQLFLVEGGLRVPMGTRVTDSDGMYLFDDLEVGTYEVEVDETTVPAGYTRTSPATNVWHKDLTADDLTLDFGYCKKECECQSGKVHELCLEASVWLADPTPRALSVYVKLDRGCPDCGCGKTSTSSTTLADLASFSMGTQFPGEQAGRNGLIHVRDVKVVDGYAKVLVCLEANCPYFPQGYFDGKVHLEVTVNGVGEAFCSTVDCHCLSGGSTFPCDWTPLWCDDVPDFFVVSFKPLECVTVEPCKPPPPCEPPPCKTCQTATTTRHR